jgi:glycosyltransferase involved in cell wall biosynthesis
MAAAEYSVLHVLPHPGGGGERYVDLLSEMSGYRLSRVYLASSSTPSPSELTRGLVAVIRRARRFDLLHVHGEVAAGLCLPLLATQPSVVTLHGLHLVRRLTGVQRRTAVLNLRAVLRAADRTICVSQAEHDELVRIVGRVAARRAVVIRNGVPIPPARNESGRAACRAELGIQPDEVVGIWVGSLDERKDPLTAVRAANRARVTLLLVGDGPLRTEVDRAADKNVRVLGQRADVPRLLAAADFYISTSRREGMSLSLLEAMAAGLVPVVTDLPENTEAVGDTGATVPVCHETSVADTLSRLIEEPSDTASRGVQARTRITRLFDLARMAAATQVVYDAASVDRHREGRAT